MEKDKRRISYACPRLCTRSTRRSGKRTICLFLFSQTVKTFDFTTPQTQQNQILEVSDNKNQNTQKTMMKIKKTQSILRKAKLTLTVLAVMMTALSGTVFAADPLATINSLSDFIFSAIKAIGFILLGFGVVQIGLSLKSHDASQRANGFLTFFGGVIIAFAKDILDMII